MKIELLGYDSPRKGALVSFFERNVISDNLNYWIPLLKFKSLTVSLGEAYSIGNGGSATQ